MSALIGMGFLMSIVWLSLKSLLTEQGRRQYGVWIPLGGLIIGLAAIGYVIRMSISNL